MERRDVLLGGAALMAMGYAAKAEAHNHAHTANPLAEAAGQCIQAGQACLQHCLQMLGSGDTSMADCSKTVSDMLSAAQALMALSFAGSKHTRAMAKVVVDVTKDCEAACRKHQDKHALCKACAECCANLAALALKA